MCIAVILTKQIKKVDNPSTRTLLIVKNVINSPNRLKRLQTALYENRYKIEIFEKSTSATEVKLGQNVFCSVSRLKNSKGRQSTG